jgi:hypothetical protein
MNGLTSGWTPRERALLILCIASLGFSIAAYLNLGGNASAGPGGLGPTIDSSEIRNGTIRSPDLRDNSIKARDLALYERTGPSATVPSGNFASSLVLACNEGDQVISAGYNQNPAGVVDVVESIAEPTGFDLDDRDHTWRVRGINRSNLTGFFELRGLCLKE